MISYKSIIMIGNNIPTYYLPQNNSIKSFYSELSEFTDTLLKKLIKKANNKELH